MPVRGVCRVNDTLRCTHRKPSVSALSVGENQQSTGRPISSEVALLHFWAALKIWASANLNSIIILIILAWFQPQHQMASGILYFYFYQTEVVGLTFLTALSLFFWGFMWNVWSCLSSRLRAFPPSVLQITFSYYSFMHHPFFKYI